MRRRLLVALTVVVVVMTTTTTAAWAAWAVASSNARAAGRSTSMPTTSAPSVTSTASRVTVTWSAASFPGGPVVEGYVVRAYNASTGAPRAVGGTCTATVTTLTCNDTGVPGGGWRYTVQARQGAWAGTESATSATVTVDATVPVTTDNSSTIGAGPHNTTKTVTLSPTDTGGSGVAATYYTTNGSIPTTRSTQGTSIVLAPDGVYTIRYFSVDGSGNTEAVKTAATIITIDKTAPLPTAITLVNAGTAGTVDPGDRIEVTMSEILSVNSMCSAWTGSGDKSLTANSDVTVTITDAGENDVLSVNSASCTGGFKFGSVALGGDYVKRTRTFSGAAANRSSISWIASTRVLSITLGTASGSVNTGAPLGTPTWTPSTSLADLAGNTMAATAFNAPSTSRF